MLQRLSRFNPYGYKLHQVCSVLDIKREDREGFPQGMFLYRLSTYPTKKKALPIKDFSEFTFPKSPGRYITSKFVGTVVVRDGVTLNGRK